MKTTNKEHHQQEEIPDRLAKLAYNKRTRTTTTTTTTTNQKPTHTTNTTTTTIHHPTNNHEQQELPRAKRARLELEQIKSLTNKLKQHKHKIKQQPKQQQQQQPKQQQQPLKQQQPKRQQRSKNISIPNRHKKIKNKKLIYLRRNRLTIQHHQLTQQEPSIKLRPHQIHIQLTSLHPCCQTQINSHDLDLLENELSIIQLNYQLLFLSRYDSITHQLALRLNKWNPYNHFLRAKFSTQFHLPPSDHHSPIDTHHLIQITVWHRACLRTKLNKLIQQQQQQQQPSPSPSSSSSRIRQDPFDLASNPIIQRINNQRQALDQLFGHQHQHKLIQIDQSLRTRLRNQARCVKVPPRIGALHFNTMEPYQAGQLVYDSEDELLDLEHHSWRKFRSELSCERSTQLSIIKKFHTKDEEGGEESRISERMKEESGRLWNQYIRSICGDPTSTASVRLDEQDYVGFVELYGARFGRATAPTRRALSALLTHLFDHDLPLSSRIINQRVRSFRGTRNPRNTHAGPSASPEIISSVKNAFIHSLLTHFDRFVPPP
ncbi:hypothetical protein PGTUg99_028611 [Puccinia graminis f. sp. tritici]|uniref:Uncharacterized protein n=1 Tax=Puccinia graminis f. sp. tritici TaxID=56615 RepID=A0A5B0REW7_PUCGR|nr:hypothetical protein PGTUg99_028611 [Puccinia graminis f. sp. tritici]